MRRARVLGLGGRRRLGGGLSALAVCAVLLTACGSGSGPARPLQPLPRFALTPLPPGLAAPQVGPGSPTPPAAIPLDSGWRYRSDPRGDGTARGWPAQSPQGSSVSLPNVFNPSVAANGSDRGQVGWYATTFTGPQLQPGRSWGVSFESVRRHATVWLNGRLIGSSNDAFAPFVLPASSLRPGAANVLVVRVDNIEGPGTLPQDWWNWGGIVGPVSLVPVGRVGLQGLGVMPSLGCSLRCAQLTLRGTVANFWPGPLAPVVVVTVTDPSGRVVGRLQRQLPVVRGGGRTAIGLSLGLRGPLALWAPGHPSLYGVQVDLDAGGRVEQQHVLQTGLRSVTVQNGVLYLNGQRLWLHGAAIHEDVDGHGAALTDADIAQIVSQLRSVGANITRAHYLLSPRLLAALDRAGILVWAQPPVDHAGPELASAAGRARALAYLRSTLLGNRSHPSVIVNSIGNELTPTPDRDPGVATYLHQATVLARQLDPGIPVALDTYCYPGFPAQNSYRQLDVIGISSYFGWYRGIPGHGIAKFSGLEPFLRTTHRRYPHKAIVVSEYGAEGLFNGPASVKGSYAFQSDYLRRTLGVLDRLPFMSGSIYWTLREFAVAPGWVGGAQLPRGVHPDGIHHKGLIAYNGAPKPALAVARQLFAQVPAFVR